MGKKHRPRPILLNEPTIPVRSIFRAATKEHIDVSREGEVDEITCSLEEWSRRLTIDFNSRLEKEPDLHRSVYAYVDVFVHVYGVAPSTKEIVDVMTKTSSCSDTGVRGSLSRLVEAGFLTRPAREYYWPADIAFVRERNLPKEALEMKNGSNGKGKRSSRRSHTAGAKGEPVRDNTPAIHGGEDQESSTRSDQKDSLDGLTLVAVGPPRLSQPSTGCAGGNGHPDRADSGHVPDHPEAKVNNKADVLYMDERTYESLCGMSDSPAIVKGPQMSKKTIDVKNKMERKKVKFKELIERYDFPSDSIREAVARMLSEEEKLFLYCNHMFDSSHFGDASIVIMGPDRTFKADNPPGYIGDQPSMRKQLVGEVDVDDVVKELLIQGPR